MIGPPEPVVVVPVVGVLGVFQNAEREGLGRQKRRMRVQKSHSGGRIIAIVLDGLVALWVG
jgi:hypothetical protein